MENGLAASQAGAARRSRQAAATAISGLQSVPERQRMVGGGAVEGGDALEGSNTEEMMLGNHAGDPVQQAQEQEREQEQQALQHPRHPSSSLTEALLAAEDRGIAAAAQSGTPLPAPNVRPLGLTAFLRCMPAFDA